MKNSFRIYHSQLQTNCKNIWESQNCIRVANTFPLSPQKVISPFQQKYETKNKTGTEI